MERIEYRTTLSGWSSWIGDPTLPEKKITDPDGYVWELIDVQIVHKSSERTSGITSNLSSEEFMAVWTWKGTFRATKAMEKIKMELV